MREARFAVEPGQHFAITHVRLSALLQAMSDLQRDAEAGIAGQVAVPPTVRPLSFNVGWPTPTGTP
jgi:hypothetical protein